MAPFNEPPGEDDELPRMEAIADAPAALPRLSIVHFLMWTAATAVAFAPYQLFMSAAERLDIKVASFTLPVTLASALYGVAQGSALMVACAILLWRSKGWVAPLQPGHWLALRGAWDWAISSVLMSTTLYFADSRPGAMRFVYLPSRIGGIAFFVLFAWLAYRSNEPRRWRVVFLILASTPLIAWMARFAWPLIATVFSSSYRAAQLTPMLLVSIELLALLTAMFGDVRARRARHWSHWLGAAARCFPLALTLAMHMYYLAFPLR